MNNYRVKKVNCFVSYSIATLTIRHCDSLILKMSGKTITFHNKSAIIQLYKRLLRSAETYPSIKAKNIYESIREDFRANKDMDPQSEETKIQIVAAYKGLSQLKQFDIGAMTGGKGEESSDWEIHLDQNPMPKPAPKS